MDTSDKSASVRRVGGPQITSEQKAGVVALYQSGETIRRITEETGVPHSSVYYVLARAGVETNRLRVERATPLAQRVDALDERLDKIEAQIVLLRLALADALDIQS